VLVQELEPLERDILVRAAVLAPSMHNTQPWRFRFRHRTLEVHRDPDRELRAEDPDGRLTMIGVGATIFNIRVAAASLGRGTTTRLSPDPERDLLAAEVTVEPPTTDLTDPAELFPYLSRRHTNRYPFADRPIPVEVRDQLSQAAEREDARLEWVQDDHRVRWLLELARDAEVAEADDPRRWEERQRWVGGDRDRDGLPSSALGPRPAEPSAVRDLAVDPRDQLRESAHFEGRPALAVLWTERDDPQTWLRAGQALQRVLVVGTTHGLAASLVNQPIEHTELRWLARDPEFGWSEPQVVIRFGYGPEVAPTPRRPIAEFLLGDSPAGEVAHGAVGGDDGPRSDGPRSDGPGSRTDASGSGGDTPSVPRQGR
jgi:nitroreductase